MKIYKYLQHYCREICKKGYIADTLCEFSKLFQDIFFNPFNVSAAHMKKRVNQFAVQIHPGFYMKATLAFYLMG